MAGIPGKGGVKGRSGAKPKDDKLVRHLVYVPEATKRAMLEAGPDDVRGVLVERFA